MKKLVLLVFLLTGCGDGTKFFKKGKIGEEVDGYTPVAQAYITLTKEDPTFVNYIIKQLKSFTESYAQSQQIPVSYVVAPNASISVDTSGIAPTLSGDSNTLNVGSVVVTNARANKLKVCGPGGDQDCNSAIIRIYTVELVSDPGIDGFVNTDDGYGVPVVADNLSVGLNAINAALVNEYIIANGDRKITEDDFTDLSYNIDVDFSNAGAGNYEMTLVIELALGL